MLRSIKELTGYVLAARDGEIGRCKDFLFDDEHWTVRYMVADTGKWLSRRKVLISPISVGDPDWRSRRLHVRLTKDQIETAPSLDSDAPVTRQYERAWGEHYQQAAYWLGASIWGAAAYPGALFGGWRDAAVDIDRPESDDRHLRSVKEVTGYHIAASDGEIGHVEDFILDDETWTFRYMVVNTRNWLPGRKVLVSPQWIERVDWADEKVSVNLTQDAVKESPRYDPTAPVNREYEVQLYDYYGRPQYWT